MTENDTPCTVSAGRGVSVLYKGRYLFSRYNPHKTLERYLDSTAILDKSLILCFSPVLSLPVDLIKNKIRTEKIDGCFILTIEKDAALYDFYKKQRRAFFRNTASDDTFCLSSDVLLEKPQDIAALLEGVPLPNAVLTGAPLPLQGAFKRVIVVEASGAVQFDKDFYAQTADFARNSIAMFWKNRMTLVNLGRLFSRNLIKNTAKAASVLPLRPASVSRPILVVGAGPSLNDRIPFIRCYAQKLYIIAADAAFRPLFDEGIQPNVIATVESQAVSRRSLIGARGSGIPIIADLCCRSANLRIAGGAVSFFISEYAKLPLLERIRCALPDIPVFPPLGSVGLAAVEAAVFLRAKNVPVFVCGLDFAYKAGISHCKEAPAHKESHRTSCRLAPAGNPAAAYRDGAFVISGKNGQRLSCDPALKGYAQLFSARYKNAPNIYDLSVSGAETGLPFLTETEAAHRLSAFYTQTVRSAAVDTGNPTEAELHIESAATTDYPANAAAAFYAEEKKRLHTLRSALTGSTPLPKNELLKLLEDCSYLYFHFPDGHEGAQLSQSFLNRVRSEIDVFLKDIETAKTTARSFPDGNGTARN